MLMLLVTFRLKVLIAAAPLAAIILAIIPLLRILSSTLFGCRVMPAMKAFMLTTLAVSVLILVQFPPVLVCR